MKIYLSGSVQTENKDAKLQEEKTVPTDVTGSVIYKCELCDKTSFSSSGLKGHVTKMHNEEKVDLKRKADDNKKNDEVSTSSKQELHKEVSDVVELLLN